MSKLGGVVIGRAPQRVIGPEPADGRPLTLADPGDGTMATADAAEKSCEHRVQAFQACFDNNNR